MKISFEELLAVSGMPGLFSLVSNKNNGLVVRNIDTGLSKFLSARKYQFSPLGSIAIYTWDDSVPLRDVFITMFEKFEETPPVKTKSSATELREYFSVILPDHDYDRVFPKDIKKVIQWFNFLHSKNMMEGLIEERDNQNANKEGVEETDIKEETKEIKE